MGNFPIVEARQELGFSPSTAVRANINVPSPPRPIGRDVANLIGNIIGGVQRRNTLKQAIEIKNRKALDDNSSIAADAIRTTATQDFEAFKTTNPPESWEPERIRQANEITEQVATLNFSEEALEKQSAKSAAYLTVESAKAFADGTRKLRKTTIAVQTNGLTEKFRSSPIEEIPLATREFADSMKNIGMGPAEISLAIKAAQEAGLKLRKGDTLDSWRDRIAEDPAQVEQLLEDELELRKKDAGNISEKELESSDIQSLLNTATNRQSQLTANAQAAINAKNQELETELHDDIVAGTKSITDISKSSLPAAAKRRLETDISNTDKRNVARTWALQDSKSATEMVNSLLSSIEAGNIDINEARTGLYAFAEKNIKEGRSLITSETFNKTMNQFKKGGRDAIDTFTDEETVKVTNALTARLNDRQARLSVRAEARTLTPQEARQFSTTGFLIQVANHQINLYTEGLAQKLRTLKIEDTSGKEAKVQAVIVWEGIKRKPLEQQINDFLNFSGGKLVRPIGIQEDLWESSDARNRSAIVVGVSKGMSNEQIRELLIK